MIDVQQLSLVNFDLSNLKHIYSSYWTQWKTLKYAVAINLVTDEMLKLYGLSEGFMTPKLMKCLKI